MTPAVAVIDPALGKTEGHHAGFAAMLAASRPKDRQVSFWTHRKMSERAADILRSEGVRVEPVFETNYYRHFAKPGSPAGLFGYIGGLAREYAQVHRRIASDRGPQHLLYHTLSWEHANALALALQLGEPLPDVEHRVLLMFNPGIAHDGRTTDPKLRLNYRVALRRLQELPGVRLYAGCGEHAQAYARLLERAEPLPIHPALVGSWQTPPGERHEVPALDAMRVLLYLGDAKSDKGFNRLPETIARFQRQCGPDARFVVQYNELPDWADSRLGRTAARLQEMAAADPRVEIHRTFWSDDTLHQQLAEADLLVLKYDPREYAEKTSGLVWLAAWHRLPSLLPRGWLTREARRIGLPHADLGVLDDPAALRNRLTLSEDDAGYRQLLFTPFWDWLEPIHQSREDHGEEAAEAIH